jgi:hypothetical protein
LDQIQLVTFPQGVTSLGMQFIILQLKMPLITVLSSVVLIRVSLLTVFIVIVCIAAGSALAEADSADAFTIIALGFDKAYVESPNKQSDNDDTSGKSGSINTTVKFIEAKDIVESLERLNEFAAIAVSKDAWRSLNDDDKKLVIAFSLTGAIVLVCDSLPPNITPESGLIFQDVPSFGEARFVIETKLMDTISFFSIPVAPNNEFSTCSPLLGTFGGMKLVELQTNIPTKNYMSSFIANEMTTREFKNTTPKQAIDLLRYLLNYRIAELISAESASERENDETLSIEATDVRKFELARTIAAMIISIVAAFVAANAISRTDGNSSRRLLTIGLSIVIFIFAFAVLFPLPKQEATISRKAIRQSENLDCALIAGSESKLITRRTESGRFLETKNDVFLKATGIEYLIELNAVRKQDGAIEIVARNNSDNVFSDVRVGFGAFTAEIGTMLPKKDVIFRIPNVTMTKPYQDVVQGDTDGEAVNHTIGRILRRRFGTTKSHTAGKSLHNAHPVKDKMMPESALLFNFIAYETPWLTAILKEGSTYVELEHIGTVKAG